MKRLSRVKMKGDRTGWDLGPHICEAQVARGQAAQDLGALAWIGQDPFMQSGIQLAFQKFFFCFLKMQNSLVPLSNCSELPKVTSLNINYFHSNLFNKGHQGQEH